MVTTNEDNIVRGEVTEADRLGNVRTYVEVGVERVTEKMEGRAPSTLYPLTLVIIATISLLLSQSPLSVPGIVSLFLLVWWLR